VRNGRRAAGLILVVLATVGLATGTAGASAPARGVAAIVADLPPPSGTAADPDAVRAQAQKILDRPEYQPPEKTLWNEISERASSFFQQSIEKLTGGGPGSLLGWIVILALVGVVAFFVFRAARGLQRPATMEADVSIEVRRSPTEWRAEAARFEAAGQWKDALRCRYRAMVADLVTRKVVPDIPGRTVGEHRADVRGNVPDAAAQFSGAAELFERAWYGDLPTGQEENTRFRSLSDQVLHEADR
jgi:hypothetical protein